MVRELLSCAVDDAPAAPERRGDDAGKIAMPNLVHPVDERLPVAKLVPLAVQHVLVMYAGAVAVPLIIGRAVNLPPDQVAFLISADLFACGLATHRPELGGFRASASGCR